MSFEYSNNIASFLESKAFVLEEKSEYSSYSLLVIELGYSVDISRAGKKDFPEVLGYQFDWGIISEYRINNKVIWNLHLLQLLEKFIALDGQGCEMIMRCLAYFDLDCWPDGTPFWGEGDINLYWGKIVDRPNVKIGKFQVPNYLSISHGTETDALSFSCRCNEEKRAREWIEKKFLPIILQDMIHSVEGSL